MKDVQNEAAKVAGQVKDQAANVAGQIGDAAQHQYENVKEYANEAYETGRAKVTQWQEELEDFVHEKPLQALLIAAGIGAFMGILWKHR
jgi:ElaB/YqjD/DUF883 family membrane-anchored ribosome-binding protein